MKLDASDVTECGYELSINVKINFIESPESTEKKIEQEKMKNFIDTKCSEFLSNLKNQQNLMNAILNNTGISTISVA